MAPVVGFETRRASFMPGGHGRVPLRASRRRFGEALLIVDPDHVIRPTALEHVRALARRYDDLVPRSVLLEGFTFAGERWSLGSPVHLRCTDSWQLAGSGLDSDLSQTTDELQGVVGFTL